MYGPAPIGLRLNFSLPFPRGLSWNNHSGIAHSNTRKSPKGLLQFDFSDIFAEHFHAGYGKQCCRHLEAIESR